MSRRASPRRLIRVSVRPGLPFILLASVAMLAVACSSAGSEARGRERERKADPVPIEAVQVEQREITKTVEVVGTLWPDDKVTVSSQVEGEVQKTLVDVGDAVQIGQVMVTLKPEELRYQVEQRTANVRMIMAQLGLTDDQADIKDIAELAEVKKAAANLYDAEQKYRRARDLFNQALLPRQDLDTAESRYRSIKADYDVTLQHVRTLQAQLRSEKAILALAEKKLRDAEIRAPLGGFIQERMVSPGQYLHVQAPVMTIVKPDPLKLRAEVPEKMATWVRTGQRVEASAESFPGRTFGGKITRITPAVNEQSRSFSIEAIISNRDYLLKPGTSVKALITTSQVSSALLVPENALSYSFGIYKVFVAQDGTLHEREVKLGGRFGTKLQVVDGLRVGELVALHPEQLRENLAVRIKGGR